MYLHSVCLHLIDKQTGGSEEHGYPGRYIETPQSTTPPPPHLRKLTENYQNMKLCLCLQVLHFPSNRKIFNLANVFSFYYNFLTNNCFKRNDMSNKNSNSVLYLKKKSEESLFCIKFFIQIGRLFIHWNIRTKYIIFPWHQLPLIASGSLPYFSIIEYDENLNAMCKVFSPRHNVPRKQTMIYVVVLAHILNTLNHQCLALIDSAVSTTFCMSFFSEEEDTLLILHSAGYISTVF